MDDAEHPQQLLPLRGDLISAGKRRLSQWPSEPTGKDFVAVVRLGYGCFIYDERLRWWD
ncbi:hypothetical protein [Roseateles sp. P5_E1]